MKHNIHGTKRNIIIFRREGGGKKWRGLSCGRDYFGFLTTYRVVRGKEEMRLFIDQWQKKEKKRNGLRRFEYYCRLFKNWCSLPRVNIEISSIRMILSTLLFFFFFFTSSFVSFMPVIDLKNFKGRKIQQFRGDKFRTIRYSRGYFLIDRMIFSYIGFG